PLIMKVELASAPKPMLFPVLPSPNSVTGPSQRLVSPTPVPTKAERTVPAPLEGKDNARLAPKLTPPESVRRVPDSPAPPVVLLSTTLRFVPSALVFARISAPPETVARLNEFEPAKVHAPPELVRIPAPPARLIGPLTIPALPPSPANVRLATPLLIIPFAFVRLRVAPPSILIVVSDPSVIGPAKKVTPPPPFRSAPSPPELKPLPLR